MVWVTQGRAHGGQGGTGLVGIEGPCVEPWWELNDARGGAGLIEVEHRRCCRRRAAWLNTLFYSTVYYPPQKKNNNNNKKASTARAVQLGSTSVLGVSQ